MSADNGIYILVTQRYPKKNDEGHYENIDGSEYRVAICQSIEDIQCSDIVMCLLFSESPVFYSEDEAYTYARKLEEEYTKDGDFLEYGIDYWYEDYKYYPNMTYQAARKALDCYDGTTPLDYKE